MTQAQIIALADAIVEQLNANAFLSPHGVDFDFFRGAADDATVVPDDMQAITRPIAGFFGLIEEWIDLDLIARAADRLPDVSFVMIGSIAQSTDSLKSRRNVHFLGHRKYETLPRYLKAFDVGLLPYKLNTQVINSNPKTCSKYTTASSTTERAVRWNCCLQSATPTITWRTNCPDDWRSSEGSEVSEPHCAS